MLIVYLRALLTAALSFFVPDRAVHHEPTVIPFEMRGDLALVRVEVNGQLALLILDTGSGVITLDSAFADRAGIESSGRQANVMGGRTLSIRLGTARSIRVGGIELTNATVAATTALRDVQARLGSDVVGGIGWDLFRSYVAEIDYETKTVTLSDPTSFVYGGTGIVLPVTTPHRLPIVHASLVTRTRGTLDARLVLDLGSGNYAIRLSTPFVAAHGIDQDTVTVMGPFGAGVGGVAEGPMLRLPRMQIGGLTVERPSAALSQASDGAFGNSAQSDGTIGVPVFRRTRMIVDLPHDRVILEPLGRFDLPDSVDASGITFTLEDAPVRALRVAYVVAGSAASKAGIQVGDELLRVDDRSADGLMPFDAKDLLRSAGQKRRLGIRRGTRSFDVSITLAPVI
jgi:hypothetical protein